MGETNVFNVPPPQSSVEISKNAKGIKTYSVKIYNPEHNTAVVEALRIVGDLDASGEFPKTQI